MKNLIIFSILFAPLFLSGCESVPKRKAETISEKQESEFSEESKQSSETTENYESEADTNIQTQENAPIFLNVHPTIKTERSNEPGNSEPTNSKPNKPIVIEIREDNKED